MSDRAECFLCQRAVSSSFGSNSLVTPLLSNPSPSSERRLFSQHDKSENIAFELQNLSELSYAAKPFTAHMSIVFLFLPDASFVINFFTFSKVQKTKTPNLLICIIQKVTGSCFPFSEFTKENLPTALALMAGHGKAFCISSSILSSKCQKNNFNKYISYIKEGFVSV